MYPRHFISTAEFYYASTISVLQIFNFYFSSYLFFYISIILILILILIPIPVLILIDIVTGDCSFLSPPTSISVRSAYGHKRTFKIDSKVRGKSGKEKEENKDDNDINVRHEDEEKNGGEREEGTGEEKQQNKKEININFSDSLQADLILVGRVDGTVDLYQVQIP